MRIENRFLFLNHPSAHIPGPGLGQALRLPSSSRVSFSPLS